MISIREAGEQDFPAICKLMKNELGYPELDEKEALKRLECFRHYEDWVTFVAIIDSDIAGFIGVTRDMGYTIEGYYAQIMALAVSENKRRFGVGTALVKKAEEWAFSQGISEIIVSSNERRLDAHAFYENLGYQLYKKSYMFSKWRTRNDR